MTSPEVATGSDRGELLTAMSTLKKNKRIKRAALLDLYGDLKPGRGHKKTERGKAKYLGGNGRKTTGISKRVYRRNLKRVQIVEDGAIVTRRIPVRLIRSGAVTKPVAQDPFALPERN
jgi:large subunit ribosomal protein L28